MFDVPHKHVTYLPESTQIGAKDTNCLYLIDKKMAGASRLPSSFSPYITAYKSWLLTQRCKCRIDQGIDIGRIVNTIAGILFDRFIVP
jgi:hypothetical protein